MVKKRLYLSSGLGKAVTAYANELVYIYIYISANFHGAKYQKTAFLVACFGFRQVFSKFISSSLEKLLNLIIILLLSYILSSYIFVRVKINTR